MSNALAKLTHLGRSLQEAQARNRQLEHALCVARAHDPSCPVQPAGGYDPLIPVERCICAAHLVNARIDKALAAALRITGYEVAKGVEGADESPDGPGKVTERED